MELSTNPKRQSNKNNFCSDLVENNLIKCYTFLYLEKKNVTLFFISKAYFI